VLQSAVGSDQAHMTGTPTHPVPDTLTPIQEAAIRAELETILKNPHFVSSKRCQDLLEFVVESALNREFDNLTERFIGAKVFGRPIEYETATDAIVRVRANDVRRRLSQHYLELKKSPVVRINLTSGSYVPEFQFLAHKPTANHAETDEPSTGHVPAVSEAGEPAAAHQPLWRRKKWLGVTLAAAVCLLAVTGGLIYQMNARKGPVERFWAPILRNQGDILICAGGNTFLQNPVPGFYNAGKEIDYPYFSLQTEVSTTLLSTLIERHGATPQFRFAATTSLPDFHEHPIILLNAYNNQWTQRLAAPLRLYFAPVGAHPQGILDRQHPEIIWARDMSLPYENTADYSLIARFWDKTTDNWVVILAGLGRNGTEAAARYVVDEHYMQELRDKLGSDFSKQNIEAVLRVPVVDGKTGSPQLVAVHAW